MAAAPLHDRRQSRVWWALIGIAAIGLLLRVGAARGDLSIDEVWTLYILDWFAQAHDRAAILVVAAHDNIHPLNTGFMAALRALWDGEPPAIAYRALSILAGTATVVLAARVGLRGGRLEGILAALVVALSYPLIHYSAEARGYAVMLAAAVASLWALERWLESDEREARLALSLCAALGVVSHLMFVLVLAGLGLMAVASGRFGLAGRRLSLGKLIEAFLLPGVVAVGYVAYFLVLGIYGNSEPTSVVESADAMAAFTLGVSGLVGKPGAIVLLVALVVAGIAVLAPRRSPRMVFDAAVILLFPALLIVAGLVKFPQPRYFLFAALFASIVVARLLAWLMGRHAVGRIVAGLLLMGFIVGQAVALHYFLNVGRGDYAAAVARMLAVPETEMPVRVGGSQDYRISMMTRYFAMRSGQGDDLIYVDGASSMPLTWYVQEDRLGGATFPLNLDVVRAGSSARFERVEVFPHWGLSGQSWALYRATP